jgi:hypothetical protein
MQANTQSLKEFKENEKKLSIFQGKAIVTCREMFHKARALFSS